MFCEIATMLVTHTDIVSTVGALGAETPSRPENGMPLPNWLQGEDISQTIEIWGAVISTVVATATVIQVGVTYLIARSISKASSLSEALDISRGIDEQWQSFNSMVINEPEFRKTLRKLEDLKEEDEMTQVRHLIFYILNIIYIAWTAEKTKKDKFDHSKTIIRDHLVILSPQSKAVISILDGNRGYNETFVRECKEIMSEYSSPEVVAASEQKVSVDEGTKEGKHNGD